VRSLVLKLILQSLSEATHVTNEPMETSANSQKRSKRQVLGKPQKAFLRFPHGLGSICLEEVKHILENPIFSTDKHPTASLTENAVQIDSIGFREILALAMRVTTARDLLWVLDETKADSIGQLKSKLKRIPWDFLTIPGSRWAIKATSQKSRVFHEGILKELAQAELQSRGCEVVPVKDAIQRLDLRLDEDRLQVAVSIPGRFLYQRRYKASLHSLAPLKEDIAAGVVRLASESFHNRLPHWKGTAHIWVPFAGSGTFAFESAIYFLSIAPEIFFGRLGAESFPCTPDASIRFARKELRSRWLKKSAMPLRWHLVEKDSVQVESLRENISGFNNTLINAGGPSLDTSIIHGDVFKTALPATGPQDLLIALLNPPYGQRLGKETSPTKEYGKLGLLLKAYAKDRAVIGAVLVPDTPTLTSFLKPLNEFHTTEHVIRHGGKKITIVVFERGLAQLLTGS
jgi:putative N6-adenine-specific DNA methylase